MLRTRLFLALPLLITAAVVAPRFTTAQSRSDASGSLIAVTGALATLPVPTLITNQWNQDVADLLYLRLADLGPSLTTAGDAGFIPRLAKSWKRRDSLTLAFTLDERARWHDGTPVTARDVVFTFDRVREPGVDPQRALLLRYLASVVAEGEHRVVFRFSKAYGEQLYDASYHVQPLPAHLVKPIPTSDFATSAYAQNPIGNGPYRWVELVPGQHLELAANKGFYLGTPQLTRVVFLRAADPDAQINLLLSGEGDAIENVVPATNIPRVEADSSLRILRIPSFTVGYLLFNERDPKDPSQPHPILADPVVRRALILALDRPTIVRAVFGQWAVVPYGPVPLPSWIRDPKAPSLPFDTALARSLLQSRGFGDQDGDGILDRDGKPLILDLNYPTTSGARSQVALLVQEQYRRIGVKIELVGLDGPAWNAARQRHAFDIDASSATLDPSPSGLVQSWSCAGTTGSNVGGYCDSVVDSLMERAITARKGQLALWRQVVRAIEADAPAAFLYAPYYAFAVSGRYANVVVPPESRWSGVPAWTVRPGRQIPRDGETP